MAMYELDPRLEDEAYVTQCLLMKFPSWRYKRIRGLVDQAVAGQEVGLELKRGSFQPGIKSDPERKDLDDYFLSTRGLRAEEIIASYGNKQDGTITSELRTDGEITDPSFINALLVEGFVVELSERDGGPEGEPVPVNRFWELARDEVGGLLPVAFVLAVDADALRVAQGIVTRPIEFSESLVIFPRLELPQIPIT